MARRAWERFGGYGGYGLANLAAEFRIDFRHHDPMEDARAAGLILLRAISETGRTLSEWLTQVEQPISANSKNHARTGNPEGPFAGEVIVFTGALSILRQEAAALASAAGCDVADGVTKQTTILVVGDGDLRTKTDDCKTSKHRKAEKLAAKGQAIRIIGESRLQDAGSDLTDTTTLPGAAGDLERRG